MNDGKKRSREDEQESEDDYEVLAKLALLWFLLVVSVLVLLHKSLSLMVRR